MMPMQRLKAILPYLVIKIILVSLLWSCKASEVRSLNDKETYKIINSLLHTYFSKNKAAYLHPEIIENKNYIISDFKKERGYYGACTKTLFEKVFTEEEFTTYKDQKHQVTEWNYKYIENPEVITKLKLKTPFAKKRFESYKKSAKDKYDLLDRKYMAWSIENSGSLLRLSLPFLSNNGSYAAVFMSKAHYGTFVWILEKEDNEWKVVCNMQLSSY